MPNRPSPLPKYRHYKPKGLAVVRIDGHDHYLGKYNSPESWERYHRLLAERAVSPLPAPDAASGPTDSNGTAAGLTVAEIVLGYWDHAQSYYRKPDGAPTGELDNIKLSLRPLRKLYAMTPARDFGPLALKAVRQSMIDSGLSRTTINQRVGKVVRLFRWAVENELVPASAHHALRAVRGLPKGRSVAPEAKPVRPVADADVEAIRPFVTRQVWALIELQRLTAGRSGEITSMRTGDLDRSEEIWTYRPRTHKVEHHEKGRELYLGPRAIEVVRPWLRADPDAYLFQPREAVDEARAKKRAGRKSPMTPSQRARVVKERPERAPGERYDSRAFAHAIAKGCDKAFPHPTLAEAKPADLTAEQQAELLAWRLAHRWHPHQLRHAAATSIRARYGLEAAQVILGHSRADVTQVYAERDLGKAIEVMREIG
jgi:integrase